MTMVLVLPHSNRDTGIAAAAEMGADCVLCVRERDPGPTGEQLWEVHAHSRLRLDRLTRAFTGYDRWDDLLAHLTPDWAPRIALAPDASHSQRVAAAEFCRAFNLWAEGHDHPGRADMPPDPDRQQVTA